jgi:hypothetical protein
MATAPSLLELQRQFAAALVGGEVPDSLANLVHGNGLAPEARLRVYRNIVTIGHTDALRTAFPAVCKLTGEDFFAATSVRYLHDCPCASGNLQDYGADFPAFLARLPEAAEVAYLADVARLEWARQQTWLAPDAAALNRGALAPISSGTWPALGLRLHPGLRLLRSSWPIFDVWMFCQEESPGQLELSDTGQNVLLRRAGDQIEMQTLDGGRAAFVGALLAGAPLATAWQRAIAEAPGFGISPCLDWLFGMGVVAGLSAPRGHAPE